MKWFKKIGIGLLFAAFMTILICNLSTSIPSSLKADFEQKLKDKNRLIKRNEYSILIDFSKPFYKKRLWILNEEGRVLLNCHVSHAWNSGFWKPIAFSNITGSEKSSNGMFITGEAYKSNYGKGKYQIGMQLIGLEKGVNNNVTKRAIVFHSSYAPWSNGCFMTWPKINKQIVDWTKDGCFLYVSH